MSGRLNIMLVVFMCFFFCFPMVCSSLQSCFGCLGRGIVGRVCFFLSCAIFSLIPCFLSCNKVFTNDIVSRILLANNPKYIFQENVNFPMFIATATHFFEWFCYYRIEIVQRQCNRISCHYTLCKSVSVIVYGLRLRGDFLGEYEMTPRTKNAANAWCY